MLTKKPNRNFGYWKCDYWNRTEKFLTWHVEKKISKLGDTKEFSRVDSYEVLED